MKVSRRSLLQTAGISIASHRFSFSSYSGETTEEKQPTGSKPSVVLELFTSQGCSSCPPADRLIHTLYDEHEDDVDIIPLSYHVDYWNNIGWTDIFSHANWTERQKRYVRKFQLKYIYTPQLVINGNFQCLGSDRTKVLSAIHSAKTNGNPAELSITTKAKNPQTVEATFQTSFSSSIEANSKWLVACIYENNLETAIESGELANKTLTYNHVVRRMGKVLEMKANSGTEHSKTIDISIDPSWNLQNLGIAALLQNPKTMKIYGASSMDIKTG
jgi:hypothetical protein